MAKVAAATKVAAVAVLLPEEGVEVVVASAYFLLVRRSVRV